MMVSEEICWDAIPNSPLVVPISFGCNTGCTAIFSGHIPLNLGSLITTDPCAQVRWRVPASVNSAIWHGWWCESVRPMMYHGRDLWFQFSPG